MTILKTSLVLFFLVDAFVGMGQGDFNYRPTNVFPKYRATFDQIPSATPSKKVPDAPITGNGDLGVVFGGIPSTQCFYISKNDFWRAKPGYPDGGTYLPGGLNISIPDLQGSTYYAEQILADGVITATFSKGDHYVFMTAWVASGENLLIVEFETNRTCEWSYSLWTVEDDAIRTENGKTAEISWISRHFEGDDLDWPTHITLALRTQHHAKELRAGAINRLVIAVTTNHDQENYHEDAMSRVQNISEERITDLTKDHRRWWRQFWSQSEVAVDDSMIERFYYGSQYLLACASRNANFPPGLWGNTITMDATFDAWAGDYHTNYNFQAPWWAAYSSNHVQLSDPYDAPLLQYLGHGRRHARDQLGVRGIYLPVGIGPKGFCSSRFPLTKTRMMELYQTKENDMEGGYMFLGQKSNAVFTTVNMILRFYYTYDRAYARKAYPYLKEVALFWEDYLTFEAGRYVSYNDNFWEVGPWQGPDWKSNYGDYNPTVTLGLLRMFFQGLIEVSTYLAKDLDRHDKWQHILTHLSDIPLARIDGSTRVKACEGGEGSGSRTKPGFGRVMMHGLLYPSTAFGPENHPEFIQLLHEEINRWDSDPGGDATWENLSNGFEVYFAGAARAGYDPDLLLQKLKDRIAKTALPNLWITQIGGGVETLSGVPSTINEMLLQSYENIIRVFPNWPKTMNASFRDLRAHGAFLVSSEIEFGQIKEVIIHSEKGRPLLVRNPWKNKTVIAKIDDEEEFYPRGEILKFELVAGATLHLNPSK